MKNWDLPHGFSNVRFEFQTFLFVFWPPLFIWEKVHNFPVFKLWRLPIQKLLSLVCYLRISHAKLKLNCHLWHCCLLSDDWYLLLAIYDFLSESFYLELAISIWFRVKNFLKRFRWKRVGFTFLVSIKWCSAWKDSDS